MVLHIETKTLCHGCHKMAAAKKMIHTYADRLYCSRGCAAKAAWLINNIPMPRQAS